MVRVTRSLVKLSVGSPYDLLDLAVFHMVMCVCRFAGKMKQLSQSILRNNTPLEDVLGKSAYPISRVQYIVYCTQVPHGSLACAFVHTGSD